MFELKLEDDAVGVSVRFDRGMTAHAYNDGFAPAIARLSPGTVMELVSIRDAVERGLRTYDFGPGDFTFKLRLGGKPVERLNVHAASPSLGGRVIGAASGGYRSARRYLAPLRRLDRLAPRISRRTGL